MNVNRHRRSKGRYAKQTHKLRNAGVGVIAALTGLLTIGACTDDPAKSDTVTILDTGYGADDEGKRIMTQDDFPCNEDEVLAYDSTFGPNHVGCLNRDDIDDSPADRSACYGLNGMPAECTGVSESHPPIDARVRDDGSWVLRVDDIVDRGCVSGAPCDPYGDG